MKRLRPAVLPLLLSFGLAFPLLIAATAGAHTCSSGCNQVRKACIKEAKACRGVAFAACDDARDQCRSDCAANAATCSTDCDSALSTCEAVCLTDLDPAACSAACTATHATCIYDCDHCISNCNGDRSDCRAAANDERSQALHSCSSGRDTCRTLCSGDVDSGCVRDCLTPDRQCLRAIKDGEKTCKRNCATGPDRRACFRGFRAQRNAAEKTCQRNAGACITACLPIVTTTTTLP